MKSIAVSYLISCYTAGMKTLYCEIHWSLWFCPLAFLSSFGLMSALSPCNTLVTTVNLRMVDSGQTDAASPSADWQATIATGWGRRRRRKAGLSEKFPWPYFSAGQCSAVANEHVCKASFSWCPIFTGPTVKNWIHSDYTLGIYSQHCFIIMIPIPQKNKTSMKWREQLFF